MPFQELYYIYIPFLVFDILDLKVDFHNVTFFWVDSDNPVAYVYLRNTPSSNSFLRSLHGSFYTRSIVLFA